MNRKMLSDILYSSLYDLAHGRISEYIYPPFWSKISFKGMYVFSPRILRRMDAFYVVNLLERLVKANAPLVPGLLAASASAPSAWLGRVMYKLARDLESGLNLPDAMRRQPRVFPFIQADLVEAGIKSGSLDRTLARLLDDMIAKRRVAVELEFVMAYFVAVLLLFSAFSAFIATKIFPVLGEVNAEFTGYLGARGSYSPYLLADYLMRHSGYISLGAAIAAGICSLLTAANVFMRLLRRRGHTRALSSIGLRLPFVRRFVVSSNMAASSAMLSQLIEAGVPLDHALSSVAGSSLNPSFADAFVRMRDKVRQGAALSQAAHAEAPLVPRAFAAAAAGGEYSGRLPAVLQNVADFYQARFVKHLKMIKPILLPMLILILGALVFTQYFSTFASCISISVHMMNSM